MFKKVAFLSALAAPMLALADGPTIDVTPISSAAAPLAAVGAAVFAIIAGIKLYKWARRAL
jgi:hypothetical protein